MVNCAKLLSLAARASPSTLPSKRVIDPVVKGTPQVLGFAIDPSLNRDSCGSVRFQSRDFWTCRDTQLLINDQPEFQIVSSSASWSEYNWDSSPYIEPFLDGSDGLMMNGNNNKVPFFPLQHGQCNNNTAGLCADSSRYVIWPDSPPMITSGRDIGFITAYTWITNAKIRPDFSSVTPDPSASLYKITYDPFTWDAKALPEVEIIDGSFWAESSIPYGAYGNVVKDSTAYLYGKSSNGRVSLARVSSAFVEDKSAYEYYVNSAWRSTQPSKDDIGAAIPNASAGGQGTYYFSDSWQSYVWIGQAAISISADFYITTAPSPEGPWQEPRLFYSGENGSGGLSSYSLQAHPDMVLLGNNEIYLSYTKTDSAGGSGDIYQTRYSTPLIKVEWKR